jgi:L-asparaginase / beta-aspartyl-peptidase
MLLVASANGDVGMDAGWAVLASGGSALDAVEAATREVEANEADHTVGLGGFPNVLGEVELDASIMDGTTRRAGAVGALQGYVHAITVARAVMERTQHVLVVGDGAARLAGEIGLTPTDLLTDAARAVWERGAPTAADPEKAAGTVNFIAVDGGGAMASAVSTSGWAWKHPGRLGDSPIIGAGNYCDGRFGAATCTGFGELAIRSGTARRIVDALAGGVSLADACRNAIVDLFGLGVPSAQLIMHALAVDASGAHHGVTTSTDGAQYVVRDDAMQTFERVGRTVVSGP